MQPVPFVGRQMEIRLLAEELERSRRARAGRLVVVAGEPGIGKSRLLDEFAARERRRAGVLRGRGSPVSTAIPFSLLVEALETRLRDLPAEQLRNLVGQRLGDLAHLFPSLGAAARAERAAPSRLRVLEGLRSLLETLARERPLILLLDDLHQADASCWEALNYLARNPPGAQVLIVAAVRTTDLFGIPELAGLVAPLIKDGLATELRLAPLNAESVADLARRLLPGDTGPGTAGWLHARARGNALYTVALLAELAVDPTRRVVPISVQEQLRVAMLELPEGSREVLEAAAVIGHSFTLDAMLALLPDVAASDLDRLIQRGLLVAAARREPPGYDFAHPLVQEAIYEGLGPARRRELHRDIAHSLPAEALSARAYHTGLGAAPGDLAATAVLRQAARRAELEEAHRDALVHLERALAIAPADGNQLRRELLDEIAWQASLAGEHRTGIRALRGLAPLVAGNVEEEARTAVRLASFLSTGAGELAAAEQQAVRAVRLLSARPKGRTLASAINELAWIRGEIGNLADQVRDSRRAAAMAAEAGADDVRMHALGCLGHALALRGEFDKAIATLEESLRLARASGEAGQVGWHAGAMATTLLLSGRGPEASRLLGGLLDTHASSSDVPYYLRARIRWDMGFWDGALEDVRQVQALNPTGPSLHSAWALSLGGAILAARGRGEEARSFLSQAERSYHQRPFYCFSAWHDWATGHALWFFGEPTVARERFEQAIARLESIGAWAAADQIRPDLWQLRRMLGEAAPSSDDRSPLRRARECELKGELAEAARIYATLQAPGEERRVLVLLRARGPAGRRAARRSGSLTERERAVAELAAKGFTDRQIADHLHLGDRTVETHLAHVYGKLQVAGRAELRARLRGVVAEKGGP